MYQSGDQLKDMSQKILWSFDRVFESQTEREVGLALEIYNSRSQLLSPFFAAAVDDFSTTSSFHSIPKSMGFLALFFTWLIGPFHCLPNLAYNFTQNGI